ncbi:hypothetical protein GMST_11840 [Geomonas silvestris]|uniref:DUF2288 domain-containing protein n=1 Tax=Geomonas silvestris TaxID=2740184 RepID=A0A6V8MGQ4_9BACT|nr:DUF2288 domain-containing protein [Geomonas silvestris]GFO58859.1 hypothetical protein GMST_11840 [Geomonas silvestris]
MTEHRESRLELAAKIDVTDWFSLRAHLERGGVILVDRMLDLTEVGVAVAGDEVKLLERWIAGGLVGKPSAEQVAGWDAQTMKVFNCLIVSPFVLVQEVPEEKA